MRKLLNIIKKSGKVIYLILPKIIRNQYDDSVSYYLDIGRSIIKRNPYKMVNLIATPEFFDAAQILQVERNRHSTICAPILFKKVTQKTLLKPITGKEPDLYILKISNSQAIGWTMGILRKNDFFHPELACHTVAHDNKRDHIYTYDCVYYGVDNLKVYTHSASKRVRLGIHLLKEHSPNYFHWLYESMPRLIYIMEYIKKFDLANAEYTILLDIGLPPQCIDMLELYIKRFKIEYKLLFVKYGEFINCDNLYYVSPFWYALDNTRNYPNIHKDFLVDRHAVEIVRNALLYDFERNKPERKIYLARRASQMRNILNLDDVESMFESMGFEIVYTDVMSFAEQRELFDAAEIVVGAAGATFSNIVFMQKETTAIIFSPSISKTNYYIFQQLADVTGVELLHFLTTPKKDAKSVHDDFTIDCNELKKVIDSKLGEISAK